MTEQEKTSAVVEETREAVDTTSQPVATETKSKNNTALILSAVAIAIALAAGVGLYGWGKQQAVNQTATAMPWLTNLRHCKKPRRAKKPSWKALSSNKLYSLSRRIVSKKRWQNSWMKSNKRSPPFPAAMLKPGCWPRPIFW